MKPIEEIAVGDRVWARDEETGELALKPVTGLLRPPQRLIWKVTFEMDEGTGVAYTEFETTDDHPWGALDDTWLRTDELKPGTEIQRAEGVPARVISVVKTERTEQTYNLEVADFHTYFVGDDWLWVHNAKKLCTGTYTNTHESGTRYHGKGTEERMRESGRERAAENNDPVIDRKHTPAENTREALKEEARRIEGDGGPGAGNYNKINSPGSKYLREDGE